MNERRVLESWKGIAAYLGRTVKTCLKWEHELGLPVHRLEDSPKAHVFAYADEIDRWKERTLKAVKTRAEAPRGFRGFRLFWRRLRKPAVGIPVLLALAGASVSAVWFFGRGSKISWAMNEVLPQVDRLIENEEYFGAFKLAQQAQRYIGKNQLFQSEWSRIAAGVSVDSNPPGAGVYIKDYRATGSDWESLGRTPIENVAVPFGLIRWKFEKPGFMAQEYALVTRNVAFLPGRRLILKLQEAGAVPEGMVWVEEGLVGAFYALYTGRTDWVNVNAFWIDKFEVTNRKFKEFVDAGGYARPEYWTQPFIRDGKALARDDAMRQFLDRTGQPGPAQWDLGTYPEGEGDYPVGGISWYEAAAYAEFAGKSLPTVFHWLRASNFVDVHRYAIPLSNLAGRGPARVGSFQGMSVIGAYDMLGNVKEWCWNEIKSTRLILGGAWDDAPYMTTVPFAKSPFDRQLSNGFRCIRIASPQDTPPLLREPIVLPERDYSRETPARDQVFEVYRGLYAYEKVDLEPKIERRDESSEKWIREKVTFNAADDGQRMIGHLFLPRQGSPPFATVIYYPSGAAFGTQSSENLGPEILDFLMAGGRAVFYPVYLSTFERRDGFNLGQVKKNVWRDHCLKWSQDLGVSIDYLETRPDIDRDKLAFYGFSQGGIVGPVLLAMEPRIKAAVLEAGGFLGGAFTANLAPEADPFNFAPRVKIPILMLNGRYDILRRPAEEQDQLFRWLGTPPENKLRKIYETDHHAPRLERIKEVTAFLDEHLR